MRQLTIDAGAAPAKAAPKPTSCSMCGGPIKAGRCRPCQKDTPAPGGPACGRWTRGLGRTVWARCEAAGLGRLAAQTWSALMLDEPLPPETAALVQDIAALPFSHRRYQRKLDRALLASQIESALRQGGFQREADDKLDPVREVALVAAEKILRQRERAAVDEAFERVHDAELVHEAVLEHEARKALRKDGWRAGPKLETEVARLVGIAMRDVRGLWGRPSDEYPQAARIDAGSGLRIEAPAVRVNDGDDAEEEAAELESAAPAQKGRAS